MKLDEIPCESCDRLCAEWSFRDPWRVHAHRALVTLLEGRVETKLNGNGEEESSKVIVAKHDAPIGVKCCKGHLHPVNVWVNRSFDRFKNNAVENDSSCFTLRLFVLDERVPLGSNLSARDEMFSQSRKELVSGFSDISHLFWYMESKYQLAKHKGKSGYVPLSFPLEWDECEESLCHQYGRQISPSSPFVLKRDGGSSGSDVHFLKSCDDLLRLVGEVQTIEYALPFIDERPIANWSLQRFIESPMLLPFQKEDSFISLHKFHIRVYTVSIRTRLWMYSKFEVRIAPNPTEPEENLFEDLQQHLTNGANFVGAGRRFLAEDFQELSFLRDAVPKFIKGLVNPQKEPSALGEGFTGDRGSGWCDLSAYSDPTHLLHSCSIIGHDIMIDSDGTLLLLESNHSPSAPPPELEDPDFLLHLDTLIIDLFKLLLSREAPEDTEPGKHNFRFLGDLTLANEQ